MRKGVLVPLFVGVLAMSAMTALAQDNAQTNASIAIRDDCDGKDPAWKPIGCSNTSGAVTFAEFLSFLTSPLSNGSLIGHPAWRMDPTYVRTDPGGSLFVENLGGEAHTFTEVPAFGGGFVAPLNGTLTEAPQCTNATVLPPGSSLEFTGLSVGNHRFQCCIHPWMRIVVKVQAGTGDGNSN